MWFRPKFYQPLPGRALTHEDTNQQIQGGLPGEHYHISAELYNALIGLIKNPGYSESIRTNSGETIFTNSNDVITVIVRTAPSSGSGSGAVPPTSTNPTPPIPDVVTPPVVVPTPPLQPVDPYWNQVVHVTDMNGATGTWNVPTYDQFHSSMGISGGSNSVYFSPEYPALAGKNTLRLIDLSTMQSHIVQAFSVTNPKQYSPGEAKLYGDFTHEFFLSCVNKLGPPGDIAFYSTMGSAVGYPTIYNLIWTLNNDGTGYLHLEQNGGAVQFPSEGATFNFPWVAGTMYYFTLERVGLTVRLFINGNVVATITLNMSRGFSAPRCAAQVWGPQRITLAARYNGQPFAVPTASYLKG